jgi:phosphoserine phosphatase
MSIPANRRRKPQRGPLVPLALFDLDFTLLRGDSDHAWGHFLAERRVVDPDTFVERSDHYLAEYDAGRLDMQEFLAFQLAPLVEGDYDTLVRLRREFVDEKIPPFITDAARELVESPSPEGGHPGHHHRHQ